MGNPSTLPDSIRPRVVIVVREEESTATHNVVDLESFRHTLDQENPSVRARIFSSVSIIHLVGDHVSSLAQHRRVKEVLMTEVKKTRVARIEHRLLFSAIHLEAFFCQALDHVATSTKDPFDFIASTRLGNHVGND